MEAMQVMDRWMDECRFERPPTYLRYLILDLISGGPGVKTRTARVRRFVGRYRAGAWPPEREVGVTREKKRKACLRGALMFWCPDAPDALVP